MANWRKTGFLKEKKQFEKNLPIFSLELCQVILQEDRCSYRPGEVERQTQPGVLLHAERVCAQNRCRDFAK